RQTRGAWPSRVNVARRARKRRDGRVGKGYPQPPCDEGVQNPLYRGPSNRPAEELGNGRMYLAPPHRAPRKLKYEYDRLEHGDGPRVRGARSSAAELERRVLGVESSTDL